MSVHETTTTPKLSAADEDYPSPARAWYMVFVLLFAYILSFVDRQILNLLVAPIRRDLGISDTEMSLLIGFSFAVFYTSLGLPFGRLADSVSRPRLITFGLLTWSLMTAGCGLARSYGQLFLLRMGVGVGEAALSPAAYSMIADSFPPPERSMPFGVYTTATYLGGGIAFIFGAVLLRALVGREILNLPVIGATRPWQVLFLILGATGVVFASLLLTLRDPSRKGARVVPVAGAKPRIAHVPVRTVLEYFLQNRKTLICLNLGAALIALTAYGSAAWEISFLVRNHHMSSSQAGILYGGAQALSGTLGMISAGKFVARIMRHGRRDAYLRVAILSTLAWFIPGILFPLVPNASASVALIYVAIFFRCIPAFVIPAAILEIVPNAMRGQATAIYLLIVNVIGLGFGPTAIALITDRVFGFDAAVRYSILIVSVAADLLAVAILAAGLKSYSASLDHLRNWVGNHS